MGDGTGQLGAPRVANFFACSAEVHLEATVVREDLREGQGFPTSLNPSPDPSLNPSLFFRACRGSWCCRSFRPGISM